MNKLLFAVGIASLSGVLLFSSCATKNLHPDKTAALDSLAAIMVKTDSALAKTDTVVVKKSIDHTFIILEEAKMNIKDGDTVSKGASEILRTLNSVRWQLQTFLGRQGALKRELKNSARDMADLSHDISVNRIPADSVNIYFEYEKKRAYELLQAAQQGMNSVSSQLPIYNLVVPKADSLINKLKNHERI